MNELTIAPAAKRDERSVELMRVQVAESKCHSVLRIGFWEGRCDERNAWGIMLADVVHHIADAHASEYGRDREETIQKVRAAFEAEMESPTSGRMGDFVIADEDPPKKKRRTK